MKGLERCWFARIGGRLACAALVAGLADGAVAGALDIEEHEIECGSGTLHVDLPPEFDATCTAGTASGRESGGNARLWTASREVVEATGPGVDLWVTIQIAGSRSEVGPSRIESLIALPRDEFEPTENWGEAYELSGFGARDFTFILDGPVKGWRCSYFVTRDMSRSLLFGRFCKDPANANSGVALDALLAGIRVDPVR